jgi:hypothetical protein
MGIGKKNDPEVRDLQAFGGENSMIGSASAASAAIARESMARSDASFAVASTPITHGQLDRHILEASMGRRQPSEEEIGTFVAALRSEGLSSPVRQESKTDPATSHVFTQSSFQGIDNHQLLLDAMLARQRQTDAAAMQERGTAILAERLLLQQAYQQRRASAAITSTLTPGNGDLALQLAALAANTATRQPQHPHPQLRSPQQNPFLPALQPPLLPDIAPGLSSDSALALLLQQRLQASDHGTNLSILNGAGIPPNLNPFLAANVNMLQRANLNQNILGNLPLANVIANANNAQGNRELETLLRVLLQSRQTDTNRPGPEQGPGGGQSQGPPQL